MVQVSSPTSGRSCMLSRLGELLFVEVMRRYLAGTRPRGRRLVCRPARRARRTRLRAASPAARAPLEPGRAGQTRGPIAVHAGGALRGSWSASPPIQYLAQWRLQLAASLLRAGRTSVAEVAERVGYGSEAALSRAFKRFVGVAPARYRQGGLTRKMDLRKNFFPVATRWRRTAVI